jgi:hypothetical protein
VAVVQTELGEYGVVLDGDRVETGERAEVRSPYDGSLVALVHPSNAAAADMRGRG